MTTMRHATATVLVVAASLLAPSSAVALGELTQKAGTAGCISETGTGGACQDGIGLDGALGGEVSPDGKFVYVAALNASSVSIFDRDAATGALTQKAGTAGCISEDGSGGACQDGNALLGTASVVLSPDGLNAYATGNTSSSVVIFDRDPTTGELTQKAGTAGCISEDGTAGTCQDGAGLFGAYRIVVSPDGQNVYATAIDGSALAIFDRDTATGALTQKVGTAGCLSQDGSAGECQVANALAGAVGLVISPDGAQVYVGATVSSAIAIFDRDAATGALTQKPGTAGCIQDAGSAGGGACATGIGMMNTIALLISADGKSVYGGSDGFGAVTIFDRDTVTGELTQKAGTAGCVSNPGNGGICQAGRALFNVVGLAMSPDGLSVYAAMYDGNSVAVFDRDPATGALAQLPGTDGCVWQTGLGAGCAQGVALQGNRIALVSPDGKNVYVGALLAGAVTVFDRNNVVPPEGVAITTTADAATLFAGQLLTYRLSVSSTGTATGVVISDPLPAGVELVSASPGCVVANATVTCAVGDVLRGTPAVREVVVRPSTANPALVNTATVTSASLDADPSNNASTATTTVLAPADVSVTMTASPDPAFLGQTLTYTINVANAGPGPAAAVVLTDELSGDVAFVSASAGCLQADGVVTCDLGALPAGATRGREVVVRPGFVDSALLNTATISTSTFDTDMADNQATAFVRVGFPALALPAIVPVAAALGAPPAPAAPPPPPVTPSPPAGKTIRGTSGDDKLVGTPGNDVIVCGAGDDVVDGGGGDDVISCGAGADTIDGGAGRDTVHGGSGDDRILGSGGDDRLSGDGGRDRLSGGAGKDRLAGGTGNDVLNGNAGDDTLLGGAGRDRLLGGAGADVLRGGSGLDHLDGGPGRDVQRQT